MPRSRSRSRSRSPRARPERRHRHRRREDDDGREKESRGVGSGREKDENDREKSYGRGKEDSRGSRREKEHGRERRDKEDPRGATAERSEREKEKGERSYGRDKEDPRKPDERGARRGGPPRKGEPSSSSSFTPATGANADLGAGAGAGADGDPPVEKEVPNFAPTGLLAAATNTVNGVVLKYSEPAEARKPPGSQRWRLFVFKDKEIVDNVDLNGNSCWLVGRDRAVADLPVDHPSCSKQHAVLQFRYVTKVGEFGDKQGGVKPYIIDLESANGTMVGKTKVPARRYLELKEGDLIMFGLSTRLDSPPTPTPPPPFI